MARPRIRTDNRAKYDRLPSLDTSAPAIDLPPARDAWSALTRRAYTGYVASEAAKSVRPAEVPLLVRYFDIINREAILWRQFETADSPAAAKAALDLVHTLQRLALSLGRELAIGGKSRRDLGVAAVTSPFSRLETFQRNEAGDE
jgi:hypothetical protein